jgi:hypothetical protein
MSLDWTQFDAALVVNGQMPLAAPGRDRLEHVAGEILGVAPGQLRGNVLRNGMYSQLVVRIPATVPHRFAWRERDVVVKLYRSAAIKAVVFQQLLATPRLRANRRDAGGGVIGFHRQGDFQLTIAAGWSTCGIGYVVLQYVDGSCLDELLLHTSVPQRAAWRSILESFLLELLIPAWSRGVRWWDVRLANVVLERARGRLVAIDTDGLRPSIQEMIEDRNAWTVRDKQQLMAFNRLPGLISRLMHQPGASGLVRVRVALEESRFIDAAHQLGRGGARSRRRAIRAAHAAVTSLLRHSDGWPWPESPVVRHVR